jgi:ABC-2 type transport system permease protein
MNKEASLLADRQRGRSLPRTGMNGGTFSALATLGALTLRQLYRGKRLLIVAVLFALPAVLAVIIRYAGEPSVKSSDLEFVLIFLFIPQLLVPLAALLYAAGMIQDEIEDQTLTYLLVRPLPRSAIYLTKLLSTWLVTVIIAVLFTSLAYLTVYWGESVLWGSVLSARALKTGALQTLALFAYCAIFGLISLLTRRSLVAGVAYIALFEGLLANVDFAVRRITVMYYFRVLAERWLDLNRREWSLDLATAPGPLACFLVLLLGGLAAAVTGALVFRSREFRLKTPEGS